MKNFIQSIGADEWYSTACDDAGSGPSYENAKRFVLGKRRLLSLYAYNSSGSTVYLALCDTVGAAFSNAVIGTCKQVIPILANSYVSITANDRFELGILAVACTTNVMTVAAGSVMFWRAGWTAYH